MRRGAGCDQIIRGGIRAENGRTSPPRRWVALSPGTLVPVPFVQYFSVMEGFTLTCLLHINAGSVSSATRVNEKTIILARDSCQVASTSFRQSRQLID
jgi:hypothetical protein